MAWKDRLVAITLFTMSALSRFVLRILASGIFDGGGASRLDRINRYVSSPETDITGNSMRAVHGAP